MKLDSTHRTVVYAAAVALLFLAGTFCPPYLSWGFHPLAFLPWYASAIYLLLIIAVLSVFTNRHAGSLTEKLAGTWATRPRLFLLFTIAAFVGMTVILRVRIPLLGDSFVIINNYENTFLGEHELHLAREPLGLLYFYWVMQLLGVTSYPGLMSGFLAGELFLGACFIAIIFRTVRLLFQHPMDQMTSFGFLCSLPYFQLFLGYAEVYSVAIVALAFFILCSVSVLRGRIRFRYLPPVFILAVATHYLLAVTFGAFCYVVYRITEKGERKEIIGGAVSALAALLLIFMIAGFRLSPLVPNDTESHYLALTGGASETQPYALLSVWHILDMTNLFILMSPWLVLLFMRHPREWRHLLPAGEVRTFLACMIIPSAIFLFGAKFDLGAASDWDVAATLFFPFALYAVYILIHDHDHMSPRFLPVIIGVTLLTSGIYFTLNATHGPALRRANSLLNRSTLSRGGYFQSVFHLSMSSFYERDISRMERVWDKYIGEFPDDPRGYHYKAKVLWERGEPGFDSVAAVFEKWMRSGNDSVKAAHEYSGFCLNAATVYTGEKKYAEALPLLRRSIRLDSNSTPAWEKLAAIYFQRNQGDSADAALREAARRGSVSARRLLQTSHQKW